MRNNRKYTTAAHAVSIQVHTQVRYTHGLLPTYMIWVTDCDKITKGADLKICFFFIENGKPLQLLDFWGFRASLSCEGGSLLLWIVAP